MTLSLRGGGGGTNLLTDFSGGTKLVGNFPSKLNHLGTQNYKPASMVQFAD